jgi:predicted MFS family arabinose efflux permease
VAAGLLLVAEVVVGAGAAVYGIGSLTLRQVVAPPAMQGRVHAINRTLSNGLVPLGALLGGVLGQTLGLRTPLVVGAAGTLAAAALILASPVRSWRPPARP